MYLPVPRELDFPAIERRILRFWDDTHAFDKLREQLKSSPKRFSFIDGPITANNPMGVHHAWGRTYKDLYQRYRAMTGHNQRFQNGFDCQGLWVEVEVERELGFTSKRDIEAYGIDAFVERCKERVLKYARIQADQSVRLGYWMDWGNSYYTMASENNFTIWHFLAKCHERGWLYRGHDVMPWCPRCGTGISQHEIDTEGYQEIVHTSLYVKFPLVDREAESLLVWTTTPWTLAANVAAAVHPELPYVRARKDGETVVLAASLLSVLGDGWEVVQTLPGSALVGRRYRGPFDELPAQAGAEHRVVPWKDVSQEEGTGIVHIAPGCGEEDFLLSRELDLPAIAPIDESGIYVDGFDWLTGQSTSAVADAVQRDLAAKRLLFRAAPFRHRYPHCWRCRTALVFRLVDEWYIRMDELRFLMMDVAQRIRWIPEFGLDRELDWLRNMHDWMISKKRYWGLALPIWVCEDCGKFDVIGGEDALRERAVAGWAEFEGHSPHRPWIDAVRTRCPSCGGVASRIPDVGNPWLDAGIVAYSTLNYRGDRDHWQQWFPADFITESFPGQYRNWFYAMLVMSTVLENEPPYRTVLGFGTLRGEDGQAMHKSLGNMIEFNEAAETVGADVLRWIFSLQNPAANLNFGWKLAEETKRNLLTLWNCYSFFVTYASIEQWRPGPTVDPGLLQPLDRWVLARLQALIRDVRSGLDVYDASRPAHAIQAFIEDLSNWYIRRSRPRFWAPGDHADSAALATLHEVLVTLAKLLGPFMPFLAEELYQNLVRSVQEEMPESVHHCDYPEPDSAREDPALVRQMALVRTVASLGHAARKHADLPVRRPLAAIRVAGPPELRDLPAVLIAELTDELNVKQLDVASSLQDAVVQHVEPNPRILGPKYGKDYPDIRSALQEGRFSVRPDGCIEVQHWVLEPEEAAVTQRPADGVAAAAAEGIVVVLDTRRTPDLIAEGWAREVVRLIQDGRKAASFDVTDRIVVCYETSGDLRAAIERHADQIQRDTLAVEMREGFPTGSSDGHPVEGEVDGMRLVLSLKRAERAGEPVLTTGNSRTRRNG